MIVLHWRISPNWLNQRTEHVAGSYRRTNAIVAAPAPIDFAPAR